MTEADEIAQAIYEKDKVCWPLNRKQAEALAWVYMEPGTPQQMLDNVIDALMELNNK